MSGTRWRVPDIGFEPKHIAHAREVVDGLRYRDRVVAALASGSRAAGLGHQRSDLDVIVVLGAEEDRDRARTPPRRQHDTSVDVDAVTVEDLRRHLAVQRAHESARILDRRLYTIGDYPRWSGLVRLAIGRLLSATPEAAALLRSLDLDAVRRSLMVHDALCLATFAEDAKGAVECGDLATALAAAEEAVRFGAEVCLTALGDVYIGRKYLVRRMARHDSLAGLLERAPDFSGQPAVAISDEEARRLIHRRLLLAGHLAGHGLTAGWQRPAAAVAAFAPGTAGPVRDPYLTPVRWAGGLALMTGVDVVEPLTARELEVWSTLDGRPLDAVDAEVRGTVERWRRAGLVQGPA